MREDEGVAAWSAFLRAHAAAVRRIEVDLERGAGLPLAWYDVLLELAWADDGRLRMSELGERVVLSRTRVSRIVDELVRAGAVRREPNPVDARSSFATITTAGRRTLKRAAPTYLDAVDRWFVGSIAARDLAALRRAMEAVVERARD